jgi:hypothetical protein
VAITRLSSLLDFALAELRRIAGLCSPAGYRIESIYSRNGNNNKKEEKIRKKSIE